MSSHSMAYLPQLLVIVDLSSTPVCGETFGISWVHECDWHHPNTLKRMDKQSDI